jgi:hypothetical protein
MAYRLPKRFLPMLWRETLDSLAMVVPVGFPAKRRKTRAQRGASDVGQGAVRHFTRAPVEIPRGVQLEATRAVGCRVNRV